MSPALVVRSSDCLLHVPSAEIWVGVRTPGTEVPERAARIEEELVRRGHEVRDAVAHDAEAAAGLELEITESMVMDDVQHSTASLHALREMGITIAIDDFGTGFSSLSYLAKLPVDTLKIDRSFILNMASGPQGVALVSTIINLGHSLGLKVVAEGVETEDQSRHLALLGCDEIQGYLLSKPVPAEVFEAQFLQTLVAK